ncbi:type IV toxin-antitoxin system AbiEi family antitoxin domain-containing protein [Acaryochloris marina NIES-2412]|uniref:type IV toxin-antitoxin system AbiEi family antitoxin domain-containing protein n=1 Tax=Acaryochloris marina TaxID=155978 RepID=UPI004059CF04
MKAIKAITLSLGELDKPVVSKYQFGLIINNIYRSKVYGGEPVNLHKDFAEKSDITKYLNLLLDEGILSPHKNLSNLFTLLGRSDGDPEDIACTVDPFCYISHLSAMSYHGLTDRIPGKLFISSPSANTWRSFAKEKMQKDLGDDFESYCKNGLPRLVRTKMNKINKVELHCLSSKHLGAYKNVKGRPLRVSTVGKTFLDMLRNPELCGGINHVIEVFDEFGKKYLRLVTDEINNNGGPIDKVRAGYILNERLGIDNEVIDSWSSLAQRGGSRKLDSSSEYIPKWSDKWKISLNVF